MIYEDGVAILRLTNVDADELLINCTATNIKGSTVTEGLYVRSDLSQSTTSSGINQKPHFTVPLRDLCIEQSEITIKCLVTGTPTPDLRWFINGSQVEEG